MTAASRPVLEVVTASTSPGRVGRAFADWFIGVATEHGNFEVFDVDLATVALPFPDEPHHPKLGRYVHEHAKQWSSTVSRADAFVFATPEYHYGYNALDFLHAEWADKAVGFLGYGGIGAGYAGHSAAQAGGDHAAHGPVSAIL